MPQSPPLLEIACFNPTSALIASRSGATRIELCTNFSHGGTTPSLSDFLTLQSTLTTSNPTIQIYIMIRPSSTFTPTPSSFQLMQSSIQIFKEAGANGFVFGLLTPENKIDAPRCAELVKAANGKPCTFHRAFDEICEGEMEGELEVLIGCGFKGVLTSGGQRSAVEGKEVLGRLVKKAKGRIDVIVGGGIRSGNIEGVWREMGARCWHSSAIVGEGEGEGDVASGEEVRLLREFVDGI